MSSHESTAGPIIVWIDYGYEGWGPKSFPTLIDAVKSGMVIRGAVITTVIDISKHITEPADGVPT